MTPEERTEQVELRAQELGFDACGVAAVEPVDPQDHLGTWLAQGFHADLAWLVSSKATRQDVRTKLAGAKSVVVVARNYYAPRPAPARGAGRVARYAWGADYHRVLRGPLRTLARFIEEGPPRERCYCSIDTGPVLEKFWAARAGLGWLGKNSLVVRRGLGSWFFLGVIVTTAELAPDTPAPDGCGDCTRCIEACPTGAIAAPRTVDARRCISYHTVENRGTMPGEIQARMGDWLFGCDACQEACPWNDAAQPTSEGAFHPLEGRANPDLAALAAMNEGAFDKTLATSPIRRAGLHGIRRNVEIVQRNQAAAE